MGTRTWFARKDLHLQNIRFELTAFANYTTREYNVGTTDRTCTYTPRRETGFKPVASAKISPQSHTMVGAERFELPTGRVETFCSNSTELRVYKNLVDIQGIAP